jgi:hypothetical protein
MADDPATSHYDELDRLAARSMAAREAAAADANGSRGGGRTRWPWFVAGLFAAFAIGLVGSPIFERELRGNLPPQLQSDQPTAADPRVEALVERVSRLEAATASPRPVPVVPSDAADLALRLQSVETRAIAAETNDVNLLARLEVLAAEVARTSTAVVQTDARTRDLFLLAVARRMLDAGRPLTPIEGALDSRFRNQDAAALEALSAWSSAPQTQRTLRDRLGGLEALPEPAETGNWWERLKARISGLVTVRGEPTDAVADNRVLMSQALAAMEAGDVGLAVSSLEQGRWPAAVQQWVLDARILLLAQEALGRLEANALENGIGAVQAGAQPLPSGQSLQQAPLP